MRKRPSTSSARLGASSPPIVALEKRIAFDGAAAATVAKVVRTAVAPEHAPHPVADVAHDAIPAHRDASPAHAVAHMDPAGAARALRGLDLGGHDGVAGDLRAPARASAPKAVVFIESDVPDVATLIKDVDHSAQIVLLDPTKNGVDAIASYLAAHKGVKDVYIFSHGSEGQLDLGTATLNSASMQGRYARDLATIKASLAPGADILVYGCDFAKGADGETAARLLSWVTGADVAASTNLTGGTADGGDFVLEDHVGLIDAPGVLSSRIALDYHGLLANQSSGGFTTTSGAASGTATSAATVATATTADGAVKIVVTVTPNGSNSANSITTTTTNAAFDTTAPAGTYPTSANGAAALEETLQFGGTTGKGQTDGANTATISIAYYDAKTGAAITVTNPILYIDRIGGSGQSAGGAGVSNSSQLTITNAGATLTKLGSSSSAFNVTSTDVYETVNTPLVTSGFSTDSNADSTKGTSAGAIQVNGSYSTLTFNWAKATNSVNGGDRVDLIFSADTAVAPNGSLPPKTFEDGQSGVAIDTAQGFSNPSGLSTSYSASGLPAGLSIDATTGKITGTIDHDASKNGQTTSGSGATLDGTYTVTVTATNSANNAATQTFTIDSKNDAPVVGTTTANQTNNDGDMITAVDASKAFFDPNGDPLTYKATGLPAGLTISSAGVISGTVAKNAQPGDYTVTVTGTDDKGAATQESFTWTVKDVPPAKNGTLPNQVTNDGQSGISIATSQGFSDSLGNSLTYTASGLPTGLSIDATTGKITGTIDHDASMNAPSKTGSGATLDGKYSILVTASDGLGGTATQTFTIDSKNQAPVVGTKTANQTNNDGDTITAVDASKAFSDSNGDPLSYTATGLPPGLAISSAGMITGTVSKTAPPGTYSVVVTATDDKGAATAETFTWTVKDVPPTAGADTFSTVHNAPVAINVLGNDSDALGRQLTITQVDGTAITSGGAAVAVGNGAVKLNADNTLTFTPNAGYAGTPSFSYTLADPVGGTTIGTVTGVVSDARPIVDLNGPQTVANTIVNGTSLGSSGWTASGGGQLRGGYYFNADYGTGSLSQANVPGLNLGAGAYGASQLSFGFGWNNGNPDVKSETVNVTVGGVVYAQIVTGTPGADPNIATITYLNGASGNLSSVTATAYLNWTPSQITIDLPANVVAKGTVAFNVDSSGSTDDVFFNNVSTTTLPATSYGYAASFSEKGSPVAIAAANASVFDGDDANAASASVVLTNKLAGDQLSIGGTAVTGGSSGTINGLSYIVADANGAETISFSGSATKAVYAQTVAAVSFANTTYAPPTTQRAVDVTVGDGIATSNKATTTIAVIDLNPSANGSLPNQRTTDGQSPVSIATAGGFGDPSGAPRTYTVTGLPAGLSIDPATGVITGTIDHDASRNAPTTSGSGATLDGTYAVTVTATDSVGRSVTQGFTLDSTNQAPTVGTATADQVNNDGDAVSPLDASKAFADGNGDPLTYKATGLPPGLSISAAGLITGTIPSKAQPGPYSVTVTATDDKGAATPETFTWTVKDVPPTTTGTLAGQSYADGQTGIAIATAQAFSPSNGNALSYSATGLPAGLSIDATTGRVTGTVDHDASKNAPTTTGSGATLDGTYRVVVTASDGLGGTASQSFTIDSSNGAPVVGTNTGAQSNRTGEAVAPIDASKAFSDPNGDPLTYSASNLPKGLTIDPATGIISGTVAADAKPGSYAVRVLATDDKGAATREGFMWTIADTPPTAKGTLANQTYADSAAGIAIDIAGAFTSPNKLPLSYTASGLPKGLSIDPSTGKITGQLDHDASKAAPITSGTGATLDGTYTVTVTASDGQGGTAQQVFKIDATNNAPALVAQTPDQTGADGQTVSLDGAKPFSDQNTGDTFSYTATGLPTGLSIDPKTGLVSGTIDPHASVKGSFAVTVTITDDKGAATSESFKWSVNDVPPVATPALPDRSVSDGTPVTVTTAGGFTNPNKVAYTYTATGLPKGLAIDPNDGVISGTIDHDASTAGNGGAYAIAVTADDGQGGTATNSFSLTSANQAPVVGTKTQAQAHLDGDTIAPVDASKAFSDPNGDPLTYSASALPAGLVIDPKTGIISGTVSPSAAAGGYSVAITATDDKGLKTTETFAWTIGSVPPQPAGTIVNKTFADGTPGIAIDTASAFTDRNNNTLSYSATGLPAGLAIDPATGRITGTLDHDASASAPKTAGSGATLDGTYTIVVTASDGIGGTATQTFTIDATNQAPTVANNTPTQTNTDGDVVSVNAGEAFVDPNRGDLVTYAASDLPPGLTIDPKTGVISGTVPLGDYTNSPYMVTVTAIDDKGAATTETFSWVIQQTPPSNLSPIPNVASFDGHAVSIDTASHFATDGTTVFKATGLPAGLAIDALTGVISGTIDHDASINSPNDTKTGQITDGVYSITVTVTNTSNPAGTTQTFALDVANQAPVVGTVTANQSHKDGDTIQAVDASQAFSDPNGDPLTYSVNDLPPGLTIDPATGKITGTVAGNAYPGDYKVTVTAIDDKGAAASEVFTWTVADVPPTTNGAIAGQTAPDGSKGISIATAGGFAPTNGNPLNYAATGLPPGLTIDPRTGVISGAIDHDTSMNAPRQKGAGATLDGTYSITVTAFDGLGGSAAQTFAFDATNTAPAFRQTADQRGQDGQSVSLAPAFSDPNGDPLTYAATNLPSGLSIDPTTGLITGTIDKAASKNGTYTVTVMATDDKNATTTETFQWVVDNVAPEATPPLADRSINDGTAVSYATSVGFTNPNGLTLTYSATGLPTGLSIDPATGLISGTLDHDASTAVGGGVYTVAVTVNDGQGGTATNTFHLTASNQAPVVNAPLANQSHQDGDAITSVDTSKAFADPNPGDTLAYAASNLPKGLTFDPVTGVISGRVAADAAPGSYYVTVTATDEKGAATPATFTWAIGDVPPVATGTLPAQHYSDSQNGIAIATDGGFTSPNGLPLTYSATGLPRGLTIDPTTGAITGFIGHNASVNAPSYDPATRDGTYTVTVTADDGQGGTATQRFTLDSTNQAPTLGTPTADQRAADGQQVTIDAGKPFADPNTGDTLTYAATGLPAGLGIDPATGIITGTIDPRASASGPYTVTVTATDNKGAATPETFRFTVDEVPPTAGTPVAAASAPDGTAIAPIDTASHFASPNGLPLTYAATGLPAGLSIDPVTGRVTGRLDHDASKTAPTTSGSGATLDGTYTVTVTASDGQGGIATQSFTFDASNDAPALAAQTPDQRGTDGQAVSLDASKAFADPNTGDVIAYAATGLPKGLAIDPATGLITGTIDPRASASGPYTVTVTATDDKGAATTETFAWTVANVPPTATPLPDQAANDGAAVSIATAGGFGSPNGLPLTYAAAGLPAGLAIDPGTGVISGTLDHDASIGNGSGAGAYTITVTASDGQGGSAADVFHLTASNQAPVAGTRPADQANADGSIITPVDASKAFADPNGDPLTYTAANLPAGLSIDPKTGIIAGTVAGNAAPGAYGVTVTATDDKGLATSQAFTWTVTDVPPTVAGTLPNRSFGDGAAGVAIDTAAAFADANGNALTFTASGLPAGLSIDPTTGRITGTLDHDASKNAPVTSGSGATLDGTYTVTVTVSDGLGGSAMQRFTLDARNAAPVVGTGTADQRNTEGDAVSLNAGAAFADPNPGDVLTYAAGNLPAGLAIDAKTGLITGTVAGGDNAGSPYAVTVTATDEKGASTTETLTWTILPTRPAAASPLPNVSAFDGAPIAIDTASHFATDGAATTYAASGLPAGLSIDPSTGRITGTLDHDASRNAPKTSGSGAALDGTYTVTVTATNAGGATAQSFTLDAANTAPVAGTKTADQANRDSDAVTPVDASQAFADPNGDALTFAASNLPAGLSIDPATGRITGTVAGNARPGIYQVAVTATDDKGAATTETFAWTIGDVPPSAKGMLPAQHLADGQGGVSIATAGGFAPSNGNPLTYAAAGLPAGLSIDPKTGAVTGTLDRNASVGGNHGTYVVTVTASDGLGGTATQTLTLDAANTAPIIATKTADQANKDGDAIVPVEASQAFADPNGDPLVFSATNLPAGLSIDPATGRITGTVAGNARPGTYQVGVTATDSKGAATAETFAWTIGDVPPTATGAGPIDVGPVPDGTTVAPFDTSASFANPNGLPLAYTAAGLPPGLVIDPATGLVTGTLDHDASTGGHQGTYQVTVTVSDGQGGTASQIFTIEATNQAPDLVAPTPDQVGAQGQQVAPVDASRAFADPNPGDVVTYAADGLPKGLAIDPLTGLIGGTIAGYAVPGDYVVTVTATDDKGAATAETFGWSVGEVAPVPGDSLPPQHFADGQGGIAIDTAGGFSSPNGLPLTYDASGLPAGLAIDPATGLVTGTLDRNASAQAPVKLGSGASLQGIYAVTVTATDPYGGTTTQVFAIEVDNVAPAIVAQTPDQHGRAGQATAPLDLGSAFGDASGDALTFAATGLPPGLALDPATGRVTGIIDPALRSPGAYTVTVTATDTKGASVAESFLYTVDTVTPSILTPPSFFAPAAAVLPNILGAEPVRIADLGPGRSVEPATPILDVIDQTSGAEEKSQVIAIDGIVVSTVNGVATLNGLERLSQPGEGIVRSGAATNELGDRIARTQNAIGRGVEALSTPLNFLGATSIDVDAAGRGESGPAINIETMLRDRVLSISVGSGAGLGDPPARVTVTLADGRPLPTWLRTDGRGYLVGKVPGGVEKIDLTITSTSASGATSQRSVTIRTDRGTITPLAPRPQAGRTLSHMVGAPHSAPADLSRIARLLD